MGVDPLIRATVASTAGLIGGFPEDPIEGGPLKRSCFPCLPPVFVLDPVFPLVYILLSKSKFLLS